MARTFLGKNIIICGYYRIANIQVSRNIWISKEVRDLVDDFLFETFGGERKPHMEDGVIIFTNNDALMNATTAEKLKQLVTRGI